MISFYELIHLRKCPLCEKEVDKKYRNDNDIVVVDCKNGCLKVVVDESGINCHIRIFNATMKEDEFLFVIDGTDEFLRFKKRLFYWKENDRYLAELLERN